MLVSIGIPFFNACQYLPYAIKSVLNQSYKNWELILIDDGSTDTSLSIANYYANQDQRIRVISDGKNQKLPFRLNQLILESSGNYITRMDADDVMHPERLKRQFEFLEKNNNYDLVSSGLISIDNKNKVKGFRAVDKLYNDFSKPKLSYPIVHPSVMARKSWYERNNYSENYPRAEDFELWTRAIINNDFNMAILPDLLLYYREEGNLSLDKIVNSYKDTLKIYFKYHSVSSFDIEVVKLNFKIIISRFLNYTGYFQKIASRRNISFNSKAELEYFQKILDQVTTKD